MYNPIAATDNKQAAVPARLVTINRLSTFSSSVYARYAY